MPWFRVDDAFHSHPKAMTTSPAAIGLWTLAGSWAAANCTDGYVPAYVLQRIIPEWPPLAEELVTRRLWMRAKGGFKYRDWDHYQLSKDEVEKSRAAGRQRQRKYRDRAREKREFPQVEP